MAKRIDFYRTPVERELLRSLTEKKNLPGLMQCLGILAVYAVTSVFCLFFYLEKNWPLLAAACVLHALFSNFIGMESSIHELSHKTPIKTRWLNELFYGLFSFLSWNNPVHFRASHTKHHQLTVHAGLDKEVVLVPGEFGISDYISWFLFDWKKFITIIPANAAFFIGKDQPDLNSWDPLFEKTDPKRKKMILWSRFMIIGHIALLIIFIYFKLYILIFTVNFSYFFVTVLSRFTDIVQHQGLKPSVPDWRITCHTMIFDPVMSFFFWHMHFHIEHHMYAAVPFFNLKKLHNAIAYDTPEPVKGYLRGVIKIMGLMKKQRQDRSWVYIPELPETAASAKMY